MSAAAAYAIPPAPRAFPRPPRLARPFAVNIPPEGVDTMTEPRNRKNVYIAGPMRGIPAFNFPAFHAAARRLRIHGFTPFSPAAEDEGNGFDPIGNSMTGNEDLAALGFDLRKALAKDTSYIALEARAVAVLPGWEKSSGARAEVALAHALGLQVAPVSAFEFGQVNADLLMPAPVRASGTIASAPVSATGEVRTTSSTGGQKGMKDERHDLIPAGALASLARHYGFGARKYADNQWRKGYEWSKSYAALQRHLTAWWGGEDIDAETGSNHVAAAAWHTFTLLTFIDEHPGFDDRYTTRQSQAADAEFEAPRPALTFDQVLHGTGDGIADWAKDVLETELADWQKPAPRRGALQVVTDAFTSFDAAVKLAEKRRDERIDAHAAEAKAAKARRDARTVSAGQQVVSDVRPLRTTSTAYSGGGYLKPAKPLFTLNAEQLVDLHKTGCVTFTHDQVQAAGLEHLSNGRIRGLSIATTPTVIS